jgi:hypothetical protein
VNFALNNLGDRNNRNNPNNPGGMGFMPLIPVIPVIRVIQPPPGYLGGIQGFTLAVTNIIWRERGDVAARNIR